VFNEQAWLMSGAINNQNNRFAILIHKAPSHNVMVGVQCATSTARTIGTIFD